MIRHNLNILLCISGLVSCAVEVPNRPVVQTTNLVNKNLYTSTKKIEVWDKKLDDNSIIYVNELSSVNGILTTKLTNLYQNKHGDLVLKKGVLLKIECGTMPHTTLIDIDKHTVKIPVILQNKHHVPTGCTKTNGAIKYIKILKYK